MNTKINALKVLIQLLGFNREEKEELLKILQQDLGIQTTNDTHEVKLKTTSNSQEYGEKQQFKMLFADGSSSFYRRRNESPVAIILQGPKHKFGLYCQNHNCIDGSSHIQATLYAQTLPQISGAGNWRILRIADCYVMRDCFHALNRQLKTLGFRQIIESRTYGVLVADDNMTGAKNWQVWFAIDL